MTPRLARYFKSRAARVDAALKGALADRADLPRELGAAMRYSMFAGGKRLRPVLALAAAEAVGGKTAPVLPAACALEMIHTYSLIHDDLPAMDDDDLRRGKPTSHKVFGEAVAILAGDALLTLAFELAAKTGRAAAIEAIARGAGRCGMVGGQVADLAAEDYKLNGNKARAARVLHGIHARKTGALITASLEAGAIVARASQGQLAALRRYGKAIGLAFQIADDILDVTADKAKLGKKGSDRDNHKLTFVSLYGLDEARRLARRETAAAHRALRPFGKKAAVLADLADYIIERDH